jgi:NADP-dependent 3-hydroxy acid dehydrogenase YdfG
MAPNIVFITGTNTGLGFETVKSLIQTSQTYTVILGSRSLAKGEEAAEQLRKEFPNTTSTIEVVSIDIESDESIEKVYETISSKHDHIDVLVNNAGNYFAYLAIFKHNTT